MAEMRGVGFEIRQMDGWMVDSEKKRVQMGNSWERELERRREKKTWMALACLKK